MRIIFTSQIKYEYLNKETHLYNVVGIKKKRYRTQDVGIAKINKKIYK